MDFLEQKERKVPRYKHIFTRLHFFPTIHQKTSCFDSCGFLHQNKKTLSLLHTTLKKFGNGVLALK